MSAASDWAWYASVRFAVRALTSASFFLEAMSSSMDCLRFLTLPSASTYCPFATSCAEMLSPSWSLSSCSAHVSLPWASVDRSVLPA